MNLYLVKDKDSQTLIVCDTIVITQRGNLIAYTDNERSSEFLKGEWHSVENIKVNKEKA